MRKNKQSQIESNMQLKEVKHLFNEEYIHTYVTYRKKNQLTVKIDKQIFIKPTRKPVKSNLFVQIFYKSFFRNK